MKVSIVAAMDENRGIGWKNQLPWHLPKEYALFKSITKGHYIIMGSRTFESLGKPLAQRTHIIISRKYDYPLPEGCVLAHSLEEGLQFAQEQSQEETFVIGGAQVYAAALPLADHLYLSFIHAIIKADAYFPQVDWEAWALVQEQFYPSDEENIHAFTFRLYEKISNPVSQIE